MRRFTIAFAALMVAVGLAVAISACGSDSTTTVITTESESTTTPTTTTAKPTTPTTTSAQGPSSCGPNQAFSQVSHTCVNTNPSGNPCPNGQVPMADRPICVKE